MASSIENEPPRLRKKGKGKSNQDMAFEQFKKSILAALQNPEETDKSRKGSVDAPIVNMIDMINQSADFVTTSSCSGRIVLFEQVKDGSIEDGLPVPASSADPTEAATKTKAGTGGWILAEHGKVTFEQAHTALLNSFAQSSHETTTKSSIVWIRHEPFILHVQCRNIEAAQALHLIAREAGFRESGITIGRKKIMLAIRTTALMLVAPVAINGQLVISLEHFQTLVELACQMFDQNTSMRDRFESQFDLKFIQE